MRILVTGATGCVGRHLVNRLAALGTYEVTALGRNETIGRTLQQPHVHFVRADIGHLPTLQRIVPGHQLVIHCAALSSPWGPQTEFYRCNVVGTDNLLRASLSSGVERFLHVSTPSVYYDGRDQLNIHESAPLPTTSANWYAHTKKEAEHLVRSATMAGLPSILYRPRGIFGPYDTALLPRLLRIARTGWFPLIHHGQALIDITYVSNVVDALLLGIDAKNAVGQTYNITNGAPQSVRELLTTIFRILDVPVRFVEIPAALSRRVATTCETLYRLPLLSQYEPPVTRYTLDLLAHSQTLDITAARQELGYSPQVSIEEGLRRVASWYQGEGV